MLFPPSLRLGLALVTVSCGLVGAYVSHPYPDYLRLPDCTISRVLEALRDPNGVLLKWGASPLQIKAAEEVAKVKTYERMKASCDYNATSRTKERGEFCAFSDKGLTGVGLDRLAEATCMRGDFFCGSIDSKGARDPNYVKQQCNEERHCMFDEGTSYRDHDCHMEPPTVPIWSKKEQRFVEKIQVCGKCIFYRPPKIDNVTSVGYVQQAGDAPILNRADAQCTTVACKELADASAWEAQAYQFENMMKLNAAESLLVKVAATRSQHLGDSHQVTQDSYASLVRFYEGTEQPRKARSIQNRISLMEHKARKALMEAEAKARATRRRRDSSRA